MTAVTPIVSQKGSWIYSGASRVYIVPFEAKAVSTGYTIPIPGVTTIKDAMVIKKTNQAVCTRTFATNVLTITETLSSVDLYGAVLAVL
jgi:hypothetical protein